MKRAMTSADRTKIIEALKNNPNAAAVARQFGFGETTIVTLCKKEGIGLQHLLTKAERTEVVEMLKTNLNALATAKQLGINHKTVLAIAKENGIDIKAMRQAAKGRNTPPFMQWARGPGGKATLQCAVYLSDGSTARHKGSRNYSRLSPSLNTSDPDVAAQRMRLILWKAIADKRLLGGEKHPAWRLYGGPIPPSTKRLLMRLAALPWAEYELQRKEAAASLGLHVKTVDWLTKQDKARPESAAAIRNRRARLRVDGHQFPNHESWHFRPVGSMLVIHPDGPIYVQITITGSIFRWRLNARDREESDAIMEPVRSARTQVRKAAEEWGACELGTSASVAAAARVVTACGRFATALSAVGAPAKCIRLAMKPPTEVGTNSLLPVAASLKPMKQVDEKKCVDELTKLIKAKARMTIPEVVRMAKQKFGVPRRRAVVDKNCCLDQAREQAKNFGWPPRGRPPR
jgi:hypothetical protein